MAFQATLPVPGRVIASDPQIEAAVASGERVFDRIRCSRCHVPGLLLDQRGWVYSEPGPYNSAGSPEGLRYARAGNLQRIVAPVLTIDLTDGRLHQPRLVSSPDHPSSLLVPAYTDFKLHDILILLEQIELLHRFYDEVVVPQSVADELRAVGSPRSVSDWMLRPPSWDEAGLGDRRRNRVARSGELDLGERAAIALAERIRADLLLIDEASGRAEARRRSLRVTGTLGVLRTAAEQGLVDVKDMVARLRVTTFYTDDVLLKKIFGKWLDA